MEQKLIVETIETVSEIIPKIIKETLIVIDYFQMGQESSGLKKVIDLFDSYDGIVQAIVALQKIGVSISLNIVDLQTIFKEMERALSSQDFVLLSDLLEYEICPLLENIHNELKMLLLR